MFTMTFSDRLTAIMYYDILVHKHILNFTKKKKLRKFYSQYLNVVYSGKGNIVIRKLAYIRLNGKTNIFLSFAFSLQISLQKKKKICPIQVFAANNRVNIHFSATGNTLKNGIR